MNSLTTNRNTNSIVLVSTSASTLYENVACCSAVSKHLGILGEFYYFEHFFIFFIYYVFFMYSPRAEGYLTEDSLLNDLGRT